MINKLNVKPEKCLFVGDQPINDAVGAERAGIWLEGFAEWKVAESEHEPTYRINALNEIKKIL